MFLSSATVRLSLVSVLTARQTRSSSHPVASTCHWSGRWARRKTQLLGDSLRGAGHTKQSEG